MTALNYKEKTVFWYYFLQHDIKTILVVNKNINLNFIKVANQYINIGNSSIYCFYSTNILTVLISVGHALSEKSILILSNVN